MKRKRVLVVPDIHGCARTFSSLLDKVHLNRSDTMVCLGDYVDKGVDSKAVLDLILDLQKVGYNIIPLRGNHEQMLLDAATSRVEEDLEELLDNGGETTLASFGVEHPEAIPQNYIDFIHTMPLIWQNESHLCVHGWLTFDPQKEPTIRERYEAMWNRNGSVEPAHLAGKTLVVGHSVVTMDKLRDSLQTHYVRLDNGCVYGPGYEGRGNLVCLDLASNELYVQSNIDDAE